MGNYNRFGATFDQVVAYYPQTVAADYDPALSGSSAGGQAAIETSMDRQSRLIAAALTPEAFRQMTQVDAELVIRYATAGQTAIQLGLFPIRAGTLHLWRYPSEVAMSGGSFYSAGTPGMYRIDSYFYKKPMLGLGEVASTDFAVTVATGAVVLSGSVNLGLGERVFATYDTNYDAAGFSLASLADAVVLGSAVEFGNSLYTESSQKWDLVSGYEKEWNGTLAALRSGLLIPDELRRLNHYKEVERTSTTWGGLDLRRG